MPASAARRAGPDALLAMSPLRAIATLAAPTTVVMLVAAASNALSTWYVSRLGADAIAAVSLVFPLSLLATTAMAGGIGAGASSAVARALGAGRRAAASVLAGNALVLSLAAGLSFAAGILVGTPTVFRWMGASGEVLDAAMVGMASGARRPDLVRAFVLRARALIVLLLALPGVLLCWRPSLWIGLFTNDPGILAVGTSYFRLIGPSYPFVGIAMVSAFAFQGLGRATTPLVWMAVRVFGVLGVALACTRLLGLGERAVFAAIAGGNVVSAMVMAGLLARAVRSLEEPRRSGAA
jgi:Na+-driven multidrug efflux pump